MLNTDTLKINIQQAIKTSLYNALLETFNMEGEISKEMMANKFGEVASECADGVSKAISDYLKGVTIMLPIGTAIPTAPGLISPTGPVTGSLITMAPVIIKNAIQPDMA